MKSLPSDSTYAGDYSAQIDEDTILIYTSGANLPGSEHAMKIPRREFDKIVRWYVTGKKTGKV